MKLPAQRVRIAGVWYALRTFDPATLTIQLAPAEPRPARPLTPEERHMTIETIKTLAKTIAPAVAGEVVPLIAAGLRARYPSAKPTLEADLQAEFAALQATYAAVAAAEASTMALIADLK